MKGLAVAALAGATTSGLLYLGFRFGVDMYFRAMGWRETRRSSKESAA